MDDLTPAGGDWGPEADRTAWATSQEHVATVLPRLPRYAEMLALDIGLLGEHR